MNKLKKRKLSLLALCTGLTGLTLGVLFFSGKGLGSFSPKVSADNNYILTLNSSNGGASFSSSYSSSEQTNTAARTNRGTQIDIKYSNVKKSTNNYAVVNNNGYLYNSTRLTGLETVAVTFSGSLNLYSSSSTTFDGSAHALTSGVEFAIDANYDYFKLVSSGETTISSIVATYTCTTRVVNYVKVTNENELTDGTYLIVNEDAGKALNGAGSVETDIKSPQSVTIDNGIIVANDTVDSYAVIIDINGSNSSILTNGGVYIGGESGQNKTTVSDSPLANSISVSDGNAIIESNTSRLKYNSTNSPALFRYYKTSSYDNQNDIALYKRNSGSVPVDPVDPSGDEPTTATYEITINKSNSGLPTSSGTSAVNRSYAVGETGQTFDVVFSAGSYNMSTYDEFRINNGYLGPTGDIKVKSIWIDFYGSSYSYLTVSANGETVTGTSSSTSGKGSAYDYEINSSVWKLESASGYATIWSIKFTVEIVVGPTAVTGVSLNKEVLALTNESSETLVATVEPENADNKNVTWFSSNESVAAVNENGLVEGVSAGSAIITVTTEDGGYTATCSVSVTNVVHVTGVSLNTNALALHPNDEQVITATVSPSNASNKAVSWSSNNTAVATVIDGTVHAVSAGTATITVTTQDGGFIATCSVSVTNVAVTGVSLNKTSTSITRLDTEVLYPTVSPSNATNKNVTWESSNPSVATVTNGTVTAVAVGSATITVRTNDGGYTAFCNVTVTPIAVTGVSLNKTSTSIYVGYTETLEATVTPDNADDKTVSWTSNDASVASVTSTGEVSAKAVGTATITASIQGYSATCIVTVTEEPASIDYSLVTNASQLSAGLRVIVATTEEGGKAISTNQASNNRTATDVTISNNQISETSLNSSVEVFTLEAGSVANTYSFHCSSGYIYAASSGSNYMRTQAEKDANASFAISVTSSGEATIEASGSNTRNTIRYNPNNNNPVFSCYASNSSTGSKPQLYIEPSEPVDPTGISLPSTESMSLIGTKTLEVTYTPSNCNQNKGVTWTSSNTTVATINSSSGVITPKKAGQTVITATSTFNTNFTSSCTLSVVDNLDEWTILMYVCGANLESDYASDDDGCATDDLREIASVSGQPSDVNIVVQAGGASKWSSTYSSVINKDKANRFHLSNNNYVKDEQFAKVNMGLQESFQDFLEWGIETYPAQKIGIIMWDHGGGMDGCCFDEQFSDDGLTPSEVNQAIIGAREQTGYTNMFEFIGYDCCLMQIQDIASLHSQYAKYQVASEESEWGYGWTYDEWVPNLFAKKSTANIMKSIVDTFGSATTEAYTQWGDPNDQTLSCLDLSKWATYKTALDNVSSTLASIVNTSNKWTTFAGYVNQATKYGQMDLTKYPQYSSYNNGYVYDVFDIGSVITALLSGYSTESTLVSRLNTLQTAYNALIAYEWHGSAASGSSGLTLYCPVSGINYRSDYSAEGMTNLTTWMNFVTAAGMGNWRD